jgi:tetraacyldisaccharide 4'-kinase
MSFSIGMLACVKQLCINSFMSAKHRGLFSSLGEAVAGFAIDVVYGRRKGFGAWLLGLFLLVLSWIFEGLVRLRLWLYRHRLFRDTPLGCKVVVVGNLTVGGTGKTPVVLKMAQVLASRGRKVAILSRGYKGASDSMAKRFWRWLTQGSRPDPLVVSDGKLVLVGPDEAGDEPYMLACNLCPEGVVVIVDRNRVEGGRFALRRFGVDTILLDDGLQYLSLRGQINLLLVDSHDPFGNGNLLPRGILREPISNLRRASYVFVTKSSGPPSEALTALIRKHNSKAEIIACAHQAVELVEVDGPGRYPMESLKDKSIACFSGIATPERFEETLLSQGALLVSRRRFLDHHAFNDEDLDEVLDRALRAKAEMIVTTEKDAVRLQGRFRPPIPLVFVRLDVQILGDTEGFNIAVERICLGPSLNASSR